jgi:hypothetical protein
LPGAPAGTTIGTPLYVNVAVVGVLNCVIAPWQIVTLDGVTTGAAGVAFTTAVAEAEQPVVVNDPVTV